VLVCSTGGGCVGTRERKVPDGAVSRCGVDSSRAASDHSQSTCAFTSFGALRIRMHRHVQSSWTEARVPFIHRTPRGTHMKHWFLGRRQKASRCRTKLDNGRGRSRAAEVWWYRGCVQAQQSSVAYRLGC
jgi:hypothetical protein